MKKKYLCLIVFMIATVCLLSLAACNFGSPSDDNKKKGETPIEINYEAGVDYIGIVRAVYEDGFGHDTEFKLDEGEWIKESREWDQYGFHLRFDNLQPGSKHKLSAREAAANENYLPSEPFIVDVTLEKGNRDESPNVKIKMQGKTCTIEGFTEEMEARFWEGDSEPVYSAVSQYTFDKIGRHTVDVRFKENDAYLASEATRLEVIASVFEGGSGSEEDPFLVKTYEQFVEIATQKETVTGGDRYFKLIADIVFPDEAQAPIKEPYYWLNIDGNGKKIIGAKIKSSSGWYTGIFERIVGTVKDLTVENAEIIRTVEEFYSSGFKVGIIAGDCSGEIINCKAQGILKLEIADGEDFGPYTSAPYVYFGGLVGDGSMSRSGIVNSSADVKVIIPDSAKRKYSYQLNCGGLCGYFSGKGILNSFSKLDLTGENNNCGVVYKAKVGGLAGNIWNSTLENSFAQLNAKIKMIQGQESVSDRKISLIGGIGGDSSNLQFINCYSNYNISVDIANKFSAQIGGIVGGSIKSAKNTFAEGTVSYEGEGDVSTDGFVCALNEEASVENCYFSNNLTSAVLNGATATSVSDLRDVVWQKAHLKWSDDIWEYHDYNVESGKYYPTLKK